MNRLSGPCVALQSFQPMQVRATRINPAGLPEPDPFTGEEDASPAPRIPRDGPARSRPEA